MSISPVPKIRFTGNQSLGSQLRKGSLRNNPEAIKKISDLLKSQNTSRGRTQSQVERDFSAVKSTDKTLTDIDKKTIKETLNKYSAKAYAAAKPENSKATTNKPGQFIYKRNINPNVRNHNEHAITSISAKFKTATVHQVRGFTKQGEERKNTSVSINEAMRQKPTTDTATPTKPNAPKLQF